MCVPFLHKSMYFDVEKNELEVYTVSSTGFFDIRDGDRSVFKVPGSTRV